MEEFGTAPAPSCTPSKQQFNEIEPFRSLQFRVFRRGLLQDRDVRVGLLPEREEILVDGE